MIAPTFLWSPKRCTLICHCNHQLRLIQKERKVQSMPMRVLLTYFFIDSAFMLLTSLFIWKVMFSSASFFFSYQMTQNHESLQLKSHLEASDVFRAGVCAWPHVSAHGCHVLHCQRASKSSRILTLLPWRGGMSTPKSDTISVSQIVLCANNLENRVQTKTINSDCLSDTEARQIHAEFFFYKAWCIFLGNALVEM